MVENEEGFLNPIIDKTKCINCGMCERVCQTKNNKRNPEFYFAWSNNELNRKNSSSGGMFGEIANEIINESGIVFGAGFDENLNIVHKDVSNTKDLEEIKGSKYVQSDVKNSYQKVKQYLTEGKKVLFSGTPCQINGLRQYLQKDYEKLYTIDVICHGVASPKVYRKYLKELEQRYHSKPTKISFRDKTYGWKKYSLKVNFENGQEYIKKISEDWFIQGFLKNMYLRESCHKCKYTTLDRQSDITLGDFWGFNKKYPNLDNDKGVSIVLLNTEKGKELFEKCSKNITTERVNDIDYVIQNNTSLVHPVNPNKKKNKFFKKLDKLNFERLYNKYIKQTKTQKLIQKVKNILKSVIKKFIKK